MNSSLWLTAVISNLPWLGVMVIAFIALFALSRVSRSKTPRARQESSKNTDSSRRFQLKRKQYLFTRSEKAFYGLLLEALENSEITVFAQMRLIDLFLSPRGKDAQWMRNKLDRKHVDFVLVGWPDGTPLLVVELDGPSHDNATQQTRDTDKDAALASASIPLLRIRTEEILSALELKRRLASHLPGLLQSPVSSVGRG